MITYLFIATFIPVLGFIVDMTGIPDVTSVPFNLDVYIRQFMGTIQDLGVYFPPLETLFTVLVWFVGFYGIMFTWYWSLRIFRMIRG